MTAPAKQQRTEPHHDVHPHRPLVDRVRRQNTLAGLVPDRVARRVRLTIYVAALVLGTLAVTLAASSGGEARETSATARVHQPQD